MHKILAIFVLSLLLVGRATGQVTPDNTEYDQLKSEGKIQQPPPSTYTGPYPVFPLSTVPPDKVLNPSGPQLQNMAPNLACQVEDPRNNNQFIAIPANDDSSIGPIPLDFTFRFFGDNYTQVYINNNGNVSFGTGYSTFTSTGFPSANFNMIAPFWADVDTQGMGSGLVYYKKEATRLTVIWHRVGYFSSQTDKLNTFKLILTNGADPLIGIGNNVAFVYGDMQWTTGSYSGGVNGFGGTPATVGFNKGNGSNACYFYQEGRFDRPGNAYNGPGGSSGIDYLDSRCFFYNTDQLPALNVDFTASQSVCALGFEDFIYNPYNYTILSTQWNFGDGNTSNLRSPRHIYASPGTYPVTLTVRYQFGGCTSVFTASKQKNVVFNPLNEVWKDTTITVVVPVTEEVIASSASTFSSAWPLPHRDATLARKNSFANGGSGVWRADAAYAYDEVRKASDPVETAKDGTYTLEGFNWGGQATVPIPKWRQVNTITKYSPYSFELENRDILNRYSAALYDYDGQFPSAKGVNMQHREMAFTSFEYADGGSSGNWQLSNDPVPLEQRFTVINARDDYAIVEATMEELEGVTTVTVAGNARVWYRYNVPFNEQTTIFCKKPDSNNPKWTLVQFPQTLLSGIPWRGELIKQNTPAPLVAATLDNLVAHAGKQSLKVVQPLTLKQELLTLEPGKSYHLSAWVSVNNPQTLTPVLATDLGIVLTFHNKGGTQLGQVPFVPTGRVIEGWQQVKGEFTVPVGQATFEITFRPGSRGTAWYDDLRLHPADGNMQSYVYETDGFRLRATLDENNFAAFFYYDAEGRLYLTKKETEKGIQTISETVTHTPDSR